MENRNISIAKINGYTLEKVLKAKEYLDEIGANKRTFPFKRLVEMYNDVRGTNDPVTGCACQAPKYYNGISNFYKYGKITLIANHLATEEDFETSKVDDTIENAENRIDLGVSEALEGDDLATTKVDENKASDEAENNVTEKKKVGRPKKKDSNV